ncbi:putative uncharacterized protein DDB_G0277255 [Musca vetustissima]|uniref:putative uncharacterized protein DDB_G0277255 n=1 Tax=Musca vetustissima TaxID=27455 RepID=UPI002AB64C99|nr:putative uncharacterized protein DDB_G0277255 [Musca vetustissima]
MTDLRRSVDTTTRFHHHQQQQQQPQQHSTVSHDSYRSSCNSSPEPKSSLALCQSLSNGSYRHPVLQNLTDHPHMNSTSGGSSSTSTTATATTIGRSSQYISENGNHNSSMGEIQFDEREIYYVSPSKRKSSLSGSQTPVLRSSLRACERLRSFSPTSAAAIAPSYPPIMPSAAYGARLSGTMGQDLSFDNYEASSHYSDTAMQVLRSGSCSAMTSILNTNNLINQSTTGGGATASSSNDSSSNQHLQQRSAHQNNVTFSNHISEQRLVTSQNRGSLRRSKGRSNQSLCSCDAGSDAELNPDPTRPLYEYSLERRRKVHTYTCEQNAQILLRLERERNRKLSLSGGGGGGGSGSVSGVLAISSSKDDLESDALSSSDAETIPPVPPPPSMKRNGSIRSLRLLQHLQQQQQQQHQQQINPRSSSIHCNGKQTTAQDKNTHQQHSNNNNTHNNSSSSGTTNNNNHSSGSIATLCSGDLLNDCTKSVHDVRAVIDDCTTSILKCANAVSSDIMSTTSTTTNGSYKPQHAAALATVAQHSKPDVCHVTKSSATAAPFGHYPPPYPIHDDITVPRSQKSDPSLCFLHKSSSGAINVGPPPLMGAYHTTDFHLSQRDLQQKLQQYKNSSRLSLSKYNTIGPSSDYARQLALYSSQQQQSLSQYPLQQQPQTPYATMRPLGAGERCRCFSKSWSNFSRDFMQASLCANHDNHIMPQQQRQQQIFHTSSTAATGKGRPEPSTLLRSSSAYNSRSFNNLVDIMDNYNYDTTMTSSSLHHHHKMHAGNSQLCNGSTNTATLISNNNKSSSSSGLKDNKLLHGHHQHLHQHYPPTQHKDFHCNDHLRQWASA